MRSNLVLPQAVLWLIKLVTKLAHKRRKNCMVWLNVSGNINLVHPCLSTNTAQPTVWERILHHIPHLKIFQVIMRKLKSLTWIYTYKGCMGLSKYRCKILCLKCRFVSFFCVLAKTVFCFVRTVANVTNNRGLAHMLSLQMSVDVKFVGAGLATEAALPQGGHRVPEVVFQKKIINLVVCQLNNRTCLQDS